MIIIPTTYILQNMIIQNNLVHHSKQKDGIIQNNRIMPL